MLSSAFACYGGTGVINRGNYRQRIFAGKGSAELKTVVEKSVLAAVMKGTTSVSNRWLAERLEMGSPSTASQVARRVLLDKKRATEIGRILRTIRKSKG